MNTTALTDKLNQITTGLTAISHPLAVVAVVVCFIIYIMTPMLPQWARDHRDTFVKIGIAAVMIGWAPDLINFLMGAA